MDSAAEIRGFLTARRARISPQRAGIPVYCRDRPGRGLRRDELAWIVGISEHDYAMLENGKVHSVSSEVVDAVCSALHLDPHEREELLRLVDSLRCPRRKSVARGRADNHDLQGIVDAISLPALVQDKCLDLVVANHLGRAIRPYTQEGADQPFNALRFGLLDPRALHFYADWLSIVQDDVARLRLATERDPRDERIAHLVGELSTRSDHFPKLWATSSGPCRKQPGAVRYRHPVVGDLALRYETFAVERTPDLTLLIYSPDGGSAPREALQLLASWASFQP